jgi:hypothetical protein
MKDLLTELAHTQIGSETSAATKLLRQAESRIRELETAIAIHNKHAVAAKLTNWTIATSSENETKP